MFRRRARKHASLNHIYWSTTGAGADRCVGWNGQYVAGADESADGGSAHKLRARKREAANLTEEELKAHISKDIAEVNLKDIKEDYKELSGRLWFRTVYLPSYNKFVFETMNS